MNLTGLAKGGYAAYGIATGNKNHRGEPMPAWDDLPEGIRTAWMVAAAAVVIEARMQQSEPRSVAGFPPAKPADDLEKRGG